MHILISGASVAGPVLAYWLTRYGFTPTVVEQAPTLRKTGGHAVDLFRPAMEVVERMGLLEQVQDHKTGTERLTLWREGVSRPVHVEMSRLMTAASDRHVEIMRDDLSEIFYDATRDEVEYVFGDSIISIAEDGKVTFGHGPPRRFDLVIGADGLHSNVRRLVFGAETGFSTFIGAYLAVDSITQIHMTTWSRGRVSLVGDAGYCPGPAVGGGTSLAVVGAYVLAGELAAAGGDHIRGFRAYEHEIGDYVRRSRAFAVGVAKRLIPDSRTELWMMANGVRLVAHIPPGLTRALAKLNRKGIRLHDTMTLKNYPH
jgi:2-polyprenyl-6-methoxyphenol hydroxylase-like FAD-dependent oxidoreductase